jgi:hypothetical protein
MDHWVPVYPPSTMYNQAMKTESRRHQKGGSPVTAYHTPPAAFNWPTEYMNRKKSIQIAIRVCRPLDSNLLPMVSGRVVAFSFDENSRVLTEASQTQGMMPTMLQIPANHIPENPTE